MLEYSVKERLDDRVTYIYWTPTHPGDFGEIVFFKDGSRKVLKHLDNEVKGCVSYHAATGIETDRDSGMVAWY